MPSTPGSSVVLTENDLYTFSKCPRFRKFGGTTVYNYKTQLLKLTLEKVLSDAIRKERLDPAQKYMQHLLRSSKELKLLDILLESEVRVIETKVGLALGELFEAFAANKFLPLFGPTPWRTKIAKSVIQVQSSGILRSSRNTLHFLEVSPYGTMHSLRNDPVVLLKAFTASSFAQQWFKTTEVITHVFGLNDKSDKLLYQKIDYKINPIALKRVERQISALEIGYDSPVLPCLQSCPFKTQCFLETE